MTSLQVKFAGVGTIIATKKIVFRVSSIDTISNVIISHFDKYPLITQKLGDYIIFKKVIGIMQRKEHLTLKGLEKIVALKANLNRGYPMI